MLPFVDTCFCNKVLVSQGFGNNDFDIACFQKYLYMLARPLALIP